MVHTPNKEVVRIRMSGLTCRSKERLLHAKLAAVPGVAASAIGEGDVLTALVDRQSVDVDALVGAIVASGLVPEEVLATSPSAPVQGGTDVR